MVRVRCKATFQLKIRFFRTEKVVFGPKSHFFSVHTFYQNRDCAFAMADFFW